MSNEPSGVRSARSWEGWVGEHEGDSWGNPDDSDDAMDYDKVTPRDGGR